MNSSSSDQTDNLGIIDIDVAFEKSIDLAAQILKSMREVLPGASDSSPNLDRYIFSGKNTTGGYTSVRHTWGGKTGDDHVELAWSGTGARMLREMQPALTKHIFSQILSNGMPLLIISAVFRHNGAEVIRDAVLSKIVRHLDIPHYIRYVQDWRRTEQGSKEEKVAETAIRAHRAKWRDGLLYVPTDEDGGWTKIVTDTVDGLMLVAEELSSCKQKWMREIEQHAVQLESKPSALSGEQAAVEPAQGEQENPGTVIEQLRRKHGRR